MKYIRTKDGRIYEIIEETENSFELCSPFEKKMGCSCTMIKRMLGSNEKPTYRLADTIEELCDEVVVVYPNGSHSNHFCYDYKSFYESIEGQVGHIGNVPYTKENLIEYEIYEIYGAIWTEWGLKYVAKMNEKGELELL